MPTVNQIVTMMRGTGFDQIDDPGFVSFTRTHPTDGRKQWLRIFWWGNPKYADGPGTPVPRAYLVVELGLDHDVDHGISPRYRLPIVDWPDDPAERVPAAQQNRVKWADTVAEFNHVFRAALDAPYDRGRTQLDSLPDRYAGPQ